MTPVLTIARTFRAWKPNIQVNLDPHLFTCTESTDYDDTKNYHILIKKQIARIYYLSVLFDTRLHPSVPLRDPFTNL